MMTMSETLAKIADHPRLPDSWRDRVAFLEDNQWARQNRVDTYLLKMRYNLEEGYSVIAYDYLLLAEKFAEFM
jgi:hypothetical protein